MPTLHPPLPPPLCRSPPETPAGPGLVYEPKWDGFRCIVFRAGNSLHLESRNSLPLQRYFPELLAPLRAALPEEAVVDGEIVIAGPRGLDFDALQLRLHPAESRVRMLAAESPATFIAFDLLASGDEDLRSRPLAERVNLLRAALTPNHQVALTPQTTDSDEAASWFVRYEGAGCDGVVAKPQDSTYRSGDRGWIKVKHLRTVDAVVGGYRRPPPRRPHLVLLGRRASRAAGAAPAPGGRDLLRRGTHARRAVAMDEGAGRGLGGRASRAGLRGGIRSPPGQPLPPRLPLPALAPRQGRGRMRVRPAPAAPPLRPLAHPRRRVVAGVARGRPGLGLSSCGRGTVPPGVARRRPWGSGAARGRRPVPRARRGRPAPAGGPSDGGRCRCPRPGLLFGRIGGAPSPRSGRRVRRRPPLPTPAGRRPAHRARAAPSRRWRRCDLGRSGCSR